MSSIERSQERFRRCITEIYSLEKSIRKTSNILNVSYGTVRYHLENKRRGERGHRKPKFTMTDMRIITGLLTHIVQLDPKVSQDKLHFYLEFVFNQKFSHGTLFQS